MSGVKGFFINKKKSLFLKFLIGAIALFILLAVLNFFAPQVRNSFFGFSAPFENAFFNAGNSTSKFLGSLLNFAGYFKENQNLKLENQRLLSQVASMQSVIAGNAALTNVSAACQNDQFNLKMVGAMGLAGQDELTINKGSAYGVGQGMPVINQQKALVGIVSKVYKDYATITLISAKTSVINAKILQTDPTKKEVDAIIKGKGGLQIFFDLIPIDDPVNQDDVLVTSALEGNFPKDILIGKVTKVEKDDHNPHQQAQVQPFFNISTDNLFVITNYKTR